MLHSPTMSFSYKHLCVILNCIMINLDYRLQLTVPIVTLSAFPFRRWANWGRDRRYKDFILLWQLHELLDSITFDSTLISGEVKKSFSIWTSDLLLISCIPLLICNGRQKNLPLIPVAWVKYHKSLACQVMEHLLCLRHYAKHCMPNNSFNHHNSTR